MAPIDRIISIFAASGYGNESLQLLECRLEFWLDDELLLRVANDQISVLPPLRHPNTVNDGTMLITRLCRLAASSGDFQRRLGLTSRLLGLASLDVAVRTGQSLTALHLATIFRNVEMLGVLLPRRDIDVNALSSPAGFSAVHMACKLGLADVLQMLLEHPDVDLTTVSTDPNPDGTGCNALHYACGREDKNFLACVVTLLRHPQAAAILNTPSARGVTPLYTACRAGAIETIRALLSCPGINPLPATPRGSRVVIFHGKFFQIRALIEQHILAHPPLPIF